LLFADRNFSFITPFTVSPEVSDNLSLLPDSMLQYTINDSLDSLEVQSLNDIKLSSLDATLQKNLHA
jgi:hypothetical protein